MADMNPLQSPAITEQTVESATYGLLDEWLGQRFDGGTHALGTQPARTWPAAQRSFGQGPINQPLEDGIEIRVVMQPRAEAMSVADTALYSGKLITDYVTLTSGSGRRRRAKGRRNWRRGRWASCLRRC
jgi:hypothetical protein